MGPHKKRRKRSSSSSDSSSEEEVSRKSRKKSRSESVSKKKKRERTSSSSDSSSSTSDSEKERRLRKKLKKNKKKKQVKKEEEASLDIPLDFMEKPKAMAPMTKEEWEKRQNVVRRVYDESTGRSRLIKGDGEVIEEIVSRERHKAINQQATQGDGNFFQARVTKNLKK